VLEPKIPRRIEEGLRCFYVYSNSNNGHARIAWEQDITDYCQLKILLPQKGEGKPKQPINHYVSRRGHYRYVHPHWNKDHGVSGLICCHGTILTTNVQQEIFGIGPWRFL
jgi:hypothetical protein